MIHSRRGPGNTGGALVPGPQAVRYKTATARAPLNLNAPMEPAPMDTAAGGFHGQVGPELKEEETPSSPPPPSQPGSAQPKKTLLRPVYDGDTEALIALCSSESDIDMDEVRDLIARGINVDERDRDGCGGINNDDARRNRWVGFTALMYAARNGRTTLVQELVLAGAALAATGQCLVDPKRYVRWTARQQAQDRGHAEVAAVLAEAEAAAEASHGQQRHGSPPATWTIHTSCPTTGATVSQTVDSFILTGEFIRNSAVRYERGVYIITCGGSATYIHVRVHTHRISTQSHTTATLRPDTFLHTVASRIHLHSATPS